MSGLNNWINIDWSTKLPTCTMNFSNLTVMSKQDAIDHTVNKLIENYSNLYVCLSGGIDSEFVANCLLERNVPFTPVIVDYNYNGAEVWYAYYWCYRNKITPKVFKLTPDIMVNLLPREVAKFPGSSFMSVFEFLILSLLEPEATTITGDAQPFSRISASKDKLMENISIELDFNSFDFNQHDHSVQFISFTPELFINLASSMDYSKPAQIAIAEYYNVSPRPKCTLMQTIFLNQTIKDKFFETQKKHIHYNFYMGNKTQLLSHAFNKEKITLTTTVNQECLV